ncbi:2Fe-2S iron-sulfur cluster binding domain-containing protein [bacterium]|nr:MAG: 2Fe-2S iron-sulfur cluster binding domain-containing protein [bacterium]
MPRAGSSSRRCGISATSTRSTACITRARSKERWLMPDTPLINLTIDGHKITVPPGTLIVEAAKTVGIEIPVFCYHHKLDPVGACRLCLVDFSPGPPRPQTACTTPVAEGMVVRTQSAMAVQARADILEFELVNHPLDCPVCDKGGECPLQDFTFRHGYPTSRIDGPRLHFKKPIPLSANIALDRERCVLCYRCTRYYDEVAWEQELTVGQRGVESFITSQFDQPLQSVFSGNIIDLCPVGALTSRVWRFESRPWDLTSTESVCSKCAVGCNVTLWQRRGQLVRVTSRENDDIDEGWICDRGRFDYTDVNDPARLRVPTVRGAKATWADALTELAAGIKGKGPKLGISLPQDLTNEEAFLFRRLLDGPLRGAKVKMHGRTALPAPAQGDGALRIKDIDDARVIVIVASDTETDVPIINLRVKKAVGKRGAKLIVIHPDGVDLDRNQHTVHIRNAAGSAAAEVRRLAEHEILKHPDGPVAILYGDGRGTEDATDLAAACGELAAAVGGKAMPLYRGTNERGGLALGVAGWDSLDGVEALLIWGPPPTAGVPASARFVAAWDHLPRPEHQGAAVLLPATTFAERQGSYTNVEGQVQFLRPPIAVQPPLKESWEVLCELGAALGLDLEYPGVFPIQREIASRVPALAALAQPPSPEPLPPPVLLGPSRP